MNTICIFYAYIFSVYDMVRSLYNRVLDINCDCLIKVVKL